ncbi:MAG: amidotransferase [Pseudomonadales bacterium]|jgi:GMP synthase-like glutamine amidotransferase|nr:amidotransferase [Pseudomonadales bacterium]MDP7144588.1 amidotransferase [Pseudomonadales bacterium]MDP7357472.1 amidotransferase [Pseudomonadales bacterium]MDP7597348.1 amidotransferase [Pseudomonadales bacterium]HJN51511.1 amidotransferase [Pseudomonadales bacterium]|tara:strand:- start:99 stop:806 length:708 start_codon:yes stop_codon:yes gene_type:complete
MIIGILQAGSVLAPFQGQFGDYPAMVTNLLRSVTAPDQLQFRTYDVEHGVYPNGHDECDAFVITGSRDSVYDQKAWIRNLQAYVLILHRANKKLVGICFGHQLIALALGGRTQACDKGWGVGVHNSKVIRSESFMTPQLMEFSLLVCHKDQVTRLPTGAELLATSDFCPNAMFRVDQHILAVQGHPEFSKGYARELMESRRDLLGAAIEPGMASLAVQTNERQVAEWIVKFIVSG